MSHFVIPAALRNNLSPHFVILAAPCYNFHSHFVTIFFTLCNSHRIDLDPKQGSWNLKTREPSSRKRDSKSRHRVQVLESRTLDSGPRTKTQDLTTLTFLARIIFVISKYSLQIDIDYKSYLQVKGLFFIRYKFWFSEFKTSFFFSQINLQVMKWYWY